jgi:hypothetical protein
MHHIVTNNYKIGSKHMHSKQNKDNQQLFEIYAK